MPPNEEFSESQINEMIKGKKKSGLLSSFIKQQYYPSTEFNKVAFCFYYGWLDESKQIMANAFEKSSSDYTELYLNFGTIYFQKKNAPLSLFCYEKYLERNKNKQIEERVKFLKKL